MKKRRDSGYGYARIECVRGRIKRPRFTVVAVYTRGGRRLK